MVKRRSGALAGIAADVLPALRRRHPERRDHLARRDRSHPHHADPSIRQLLALGAADLGRLFGARLRRLLRGDGRRARGTPRPVVVRVGAGGRRGARRRGDRRGRSAPRPAGVRTAPPPRRPHDPGLRLVRRGAARAQRHPDGVRSRSLLLLERAADRDPDWRRAGDAGPDLRARTDRGAGGSPCICS